MLRRIGRTFVLLLALSGPASLSAQDINTTTGGTDAWEGAALGMWTSGVTAYVGFGQLFTAPVGYPVLDAFSFFVGDFDNQLVSPDLLMYRAFLGAWNGTSVTSILWQGDDQPNKTSPPVYYGGEELSAYEEVSFTPGQSLSPGAVYLAFLFPRLGTGFPTGGYDADLMAVRARQNSPSGVADGLGGAVRVAGPVVPGAQPVPTDWAPYGSVDAAFTASFSQAPPTVVPEPGTWLLLGTGLLGLGIVALRRRESGEGAAD